RVAVRSFWILRLEETYVLPGPAPVSRLGHPNGEVLAGAQDAEAHPRLPPLVIAHEEFPAHSRLAVGLPRREVVGLLQPEVADGLSCGVGARKRADRVRAAPRPHEILDGCDLLLRHWRSLRRRSSSEECGGE